MFFMKIKTYLTGFTGFDGSIASARESYIITFSRQIIRFRLVPYPYTLFQEKAICNSLFFIKYIAFKEPVW